MLAPVRVTAPALPPVSLTQAKAHLRVEHDEDDLYISELIDTATARLDGWSGILGRALVTQTWRHDFPGWPEDGKLRLPLAPVLSVEGITYIAPDGAVQTLDASAYTAPRADGLGPYVRLRQGHSWPATARDEDAVSVTFTAGYGATVAAVPADIRHAILLLVGHWYNAREAASETALTELPLGVSALLAPYRRISL
ncbi:head-tail connector protein [Xanthobacter sp. V2C-8]|uniref:head-tail connector protein n=1 Tax=Xanthobacter albus TaxID=3119929 RepID=UPI0037285E6B